jgi:hypothetical protein
VGGRRQRQRTCAVAPERGVGQDLRLQLLQRGDPAAGLQLQHAPGLQRRGGQHGCPAGVARQPGVRRPEQRACGKGATRRVSGTAGAWQVFAARAALGGLGRGGEGRGGAGRGGAGRGGRCVAGQWPAMLQRCPAAGTLPPPSQLSVALLSCASLRLQRLPLYATCGSTLLAQPLALATRLFAGRSVPLAAPVVPRVLPLADRRCTESRVRWPARCATSTLPEEAS